jgi:hypothetical protein
MSDYITGLRGDLVEAAARHRRRGALARTTISLRPRAWSRPALAAGLVAAACLAAVVVAVRALGPPETAPTQPHRILTVRLGAEPFDAVYAAGSLWVVGAKGEVVRVGDGRVVDRSRVGQLGHSIAADGQSVWVTADADVFSGADNLFNSYLVEIDARSGAVKRRILKHSSGIGLVAAGAGGVWLDPETTQTSDRIERYDPVTGRRVAVVRSEYLNALAAGDEAVWALRGDGAVAQIDPASNRVVAEVPGATESRNQNGPGHASLAADGNGVWVAGGVRGDVVLVQGGRIARRIRIGEGEVAVVARTRDALWATLETGAVRSSFRLIRIDPETGRRTGAMDLGHLRPVALAPAGRDVWVVTLDGTAALVRG